MNTHEDYLTDIPHEIAMRAYSGTSWTPEDRARMVRNEYAVGLAVDWEHLLELATTDEKRATLEAEWPAHRATCRVATLAWLGAHGACVSTMITGRSNFNVRRADKANARELRASQSMVKAREDSRDRIRRLLRPEDRPIMAGDGDAVSRLEAEIAKAEETQDRFRAINAAIRKHRKSGTEAQVGALRELGYSESFARQLLQEDDCGRIGIPDYRLTNNSANIRRMRQRLDALRVTKAQDLEQLEGEHATYEDDPPANRVRLIFAGKPDADVRTRLKSAGFRWAPAGGCWQAYRNHNSLVVAREVAGVP